MKDFDPMQYGPAIAALLTQRNPNSLGPGTPNTGMKAALNAASVESLFAYTKIIDIDMAKACLSGLWLYHDFLDESHTISQSIHSTTGSYWHGIMHRREPDYSNAGYWFHKVGNHAIFDTLCAEASRKAQEMGTSSSSVFLARQVKWDTYAFIRLCESSYCTESQDEQLCGNIQFLEWHILFEYSFQQTIL